MFILLILIFFPMLNMVSIGLSYWCCTVLNNQQLQRAITLPKAEAIDPAGEIKKTIVDAWKNTGLGKFTRVTTDPTTNVTYDDNGVGDKVVTVATTFSASPFLPVPFPMQVPGLNAPMPFTIASSRPMEDADLAK